MVPIRIVLSLALVVGAVSAGPAASKPPSELGLIEKGLARAVADGQLSPDEAVSYRSIARRALSEIGSLPPARAKNLAGSLRDVAAQWRGYTGPRALTLFSMLQANLERPLVPGRDILGEDGAVYRFVSGHGLVFHPLANAARLNKLVLGGNDEAAEKLAGGLVARAVPAAGGLVWEYPFPFGRGRPPWTSGMAQAVMAQALARTGNLLSDEALLEAAERAYRAIPGRLVFDLAPGPWIRLYDWSRLTVLNAQLQALISVGDYAEITGDVQALSLAERMRVAAAALLRRFDTGYWSLYALGGRESPLSYHEYVVDLLRSLTLRTGDPAWRETADRFLRYEEEPPLLRPGPGSPTVYPVPVDGYRDVARLEFWLSKRSRVTLRVGKSAQVATLDGGWRTLVWAPRGRTPGTYRPRLAAVDMAGNRAQAALPPFLVRHVRTPPTVGARVDPPATLVWESPDEWTPWLELSVRLQGSGDTHELDLGRRRLRGRAVLRLPEGRWRATLVAVASSGRKRSVALGYVPR